MIKTKTLFGYSLQWSGGALHAQSRETLEKYVKNYNFEFAQTWCGRISFCDIEKDRPVPVEFFSLGLIQTLD